MFSSVILHRHRHWIDPPKEKIHCGAVDRLIEAKIKTNVHETNEGRINKYLFRL